ncbi:MAG: hypothetical protein AAGD13_15540 [Pseudomonadota bacterium]
MTRPGTTDLAALMLATLTAGAALGQEWSRSGPNGTVDRSYDADTGFTINRSGTNGGSSTGTVSCSGGGTCQRDYSVTGADGQSASGQRVTRRGPWGARSANTVTDSDGNAATRYRAAPAPRAYRPRARRAIRW